ncbi:hypothetical protein P4O66_017803 [Electrophorus voltai]|uniref:RING-type E3 ubiquitin transferase n=1 Tax=Electrophorus voltai TaxID=2609070 RepID=A0AAD8YRR9_9TELE|nr:hypothetical protein P4O66_017803 [Electrophorus voltai]
MPPVSEADVQLVHEGPGKLVLADCLCPVCLEIFLEPVTLPCTHTFCKPCFLETVDKANMCCPLCRKRVSTWARHNGRNKTLVNMELWRRIQEAFPAQCQRRLNGVDGDDMNAFIPKPKVSLPGELRKEYEDQISKFVEEKRALEEAERKASEEYIQRLLAEEEQRVVEDRRRQEEKLEDDEKLARILSKELNSSQILESQRNIKPNDATSAKTKKSSVGHIEKFLCPMPSGQPHCETSPATTFLANKETILNAPLTLLPCAAGPCSLEMPASNSCSTSWHSNSDPDPREQVSPASESSSFPKRKMEDSELAGDADLHKRPCSSPQGNLTLQELALQEALWSRWQQEEEDRQLAQRIQRELDRENIMDRRKGSADSYMLRQKSSPLPTTTTTTTTSSSSSSTTPAAACVSRQRVGREKAGKRVSRAGRQPEGKIPKEGLASARMSPSSASPAQRGAKQKQTTLAEMFPSMGR